MAGQFDVSPGGAAIYSIPISVPPGTAGIEPKLRLAYSSQDGNGLLGVGWRLSGLSSITRCPATIAQDGFPDAADFDDNDRLCLDGSRLVAVSGTYGEQGAEYRTEIESFVKVRQNGGDLNSGNVWFEVWTKSGLVKEYGNGNNAAFDVPGQSYTLLWSVSRVGDTVGNYFEVSYTQDSNSNEYYVDRIDYTGNDQAGQMPYNSVRFEYESRPDVGSRYMAGGSDEVRSELRLKGVKTYVQSTLVRAYSLSYSISPTSGRSLLTSVEECAYTNSNPDCLPATEFSWTEKELGYTEYSELAPPSDAHQCGIIADINGDGRSDIAQACVNNHRTYLNKINEDGSQEWEVSAAHKLPDHMTNDNGNVVATLLDINGDGLSDFINPTSWGSGQVVYLNTSNGWQKDDSYILPHEHSKDLLERGALQDLNGDGLPDLIYVPIGGNPETYLNSGSSCTSNSCRWQRAPAYDMPYEGASLYGLSRLNDITGDGLPDYIVSIYDYSSASEGSISIQSETYINTGAGWELSPEYALPAAKEIDIGFFGFGPSESSRFKDVNGDGLADLICMTNIPDNIMASIYNHSLPLLIILL